MGMKVQQVEFAVLPISYRNELATLNK